MKLFSFVLIPPFDLAFSSDPIPIPSRSLLLNDFLVFIIVDGKEIWYTFDQPSPRELARGVTIYCYDITLNSAQKWNGSGWINESLSDNSLTDGNNQIRFYPEEWLFEYYNTREGKWILIPRL